MSTLPRREQIPVEQTWGIESLFASVEAWDAAFAAMEQELPQLAAFKGTLGQSSANLLGWIRKAEDVGPRLSAVMSYAMMRADQDLGNQQHSGMAARARGLMARVQAALSFAEPELLALDEARLNALVAGEPALARYSHYFALLNRKRPHVRSAEVEELLAQAQDAFSAPAQAYGMLANTDIKFANATGADGAAHTVAQGSIGELLGSEDRALRRSAFNSFSDGFLGVKNTMAAVLGGKIKGTVLQARARRYPDALTMSLQPHALQQAYHTVIDACNRHLPIWHRYWDARRKLLKLDKLEVCDIFAPLAPRMHVPYSLAVDWICEGMAPLGAGYVTRMREGLTTGRWVDRARNLGKRQGAYSNGTYGNKSFILMSYSEAAGLQSMSTLAHEVGHSMHSTLSNEAQPFLLARYSLFAAEVASNFNQALVRAHLLGRLTAREQQIAIIDEAMGNLHRYLFLMPILSQWEHWAHQQAEAGRALTADGMSAHLAGLFRAAYGPAVQTDEARAGITWSQFNHFYSSFYVWQYASGIAAANALADVVLQQPSMAADYLRFLTLGGSMDPMDELKVAGIDMSTTEPMDRAFGVLDGFVRRLEALV